MANVLFKRVEDSSQLDNIPVVDGSFYVTGDGKSFIDYGEERLPVGGTPDTEMSDRSTNTVENNVIKRYVDESVISRQILWTNPNPTADFATQTINLSSSDYDVLEWYCRSDTATNFTFCQKSLKGFGTQIVYSSQGSGSRHWIRRIYWVSNTQFSCADCVRVDGTSTSNANEQDVPLYVVGYKTGLFE